MSLLNLKQRIQKVEADVSELMEAVGLYEEEAQSDGQAISGPEEGAGEAGENETQEKVAG